MEILTRRPVCQESGGTCREGSTSDVPSVPIGAYMQNNLTPAKKGWRSGVSPAWYQYRGRVCAKYPDGMTHRLTSASRLHRWKLEGRSCTAGQRQAALRGRPSYDEYTETRDKTHAYLNVDIVLVHHFGSDLIFETLMSEYMAPCSISGIILMVLFITPCTLHAQWQAEYPTCTRRPKFWNTTTPQVKETYG